MCLPKLSNFVRFRIGIAARVAFLGQNRAVPGGRQSMIDAEKGVGKIGWSQGVTRRVNKK